MDPFDEMLTPQGVREPYASLQQWHDTQTPEKLSGKVSDAEGAFRKTGITFAVYGDDQAAERLIPFDIIPRIITGREWRKLSQGIEQRVIALNAFLDDIYHRQEIVKAGRIPRELITNNEAFLPEMIGFRPPGNVYTSLILGGQIKGEEPRLFYIYPEGNFIVSSEDTPFFQIGEHKYGKPILVRAYDKEMRFEHAIKLLLVSFDSTLKSNLSVGLPLDMQTYAANSFSLDEKRRFERNDPYYTAISEGWGEALKNAFHQLPSLRCLGSCCGARILTARVQQSS